MRLRARTLVVMSCIFAGLSQAAANAEFTVFFPGPNTDELNPSQWRLTDAAGDVVKEAAAEHKKRGGFIVLAGHDQSVGSEANAMVRSQRRADAVKDALIKDGVSANVIRTKACGFANLMVATPMGASEPQNRRVVFWRAATKADLASLERDACTLVPGRR